jgi:hypothetical protein
MVAFLTADQQNSPFVGRMATDAIPFFYEHLRNIERTEKLDLFIYSQGGDTIVPWRFITLARERCKQLAILIPYKAHSAATMLALGADEIIMGEMGELSPIDPSIGTPFNPRKDDQTKGPPIEISVEDVAGFFNFAKDRLNITSEDNLIQALGMLIQKLHPLALGSVYRSHALIRMIARKMLAIHMKEATDEPLISQIVDNLAEKLYYHNYVIGRQEAKSLGLKVVNPPEKLEEKLWNLYKAYQSEMGLGETFDPGKYTLDITEIERPVAILDSVGLRSSFRKKLQIKTKEKEQVEQPEFLIREQIFPWQSETVEIKENKK